MLKRILMPTDGSACSEGAITKGLEFAKAMNAEVTFLYAIIYVPPNFAAPAMIAAYEDLKEDATNTLQRARKLALEAGINSRQVLLEGVQLEDAIHHAAHDHDLIVMGADEKRGLGHFFFGSLSERVMKHATKPCLLIRHIEAKPAPKPQGWQHNTQAPH
jgi:nucleotide-binding universal stress UspA family protein